MTTVSSKAGSVTAVNGIYRAASAVRNHLERSVLHENDLTWTGFVVLSSVRDLQSPETRVVAEEVGISKGTLTGVVKTLEARGLLERLDHPSDGRLVLLKLTRQGESLMGKLIPAFTKEEEFVVSSLSQRDRSTLARQLNGIVSHLESDSGKRTATVRAARSRRRRAR